MSKILLLLAPGFEEIEALGTCDVLRRLGLEVTTAALNGREVAGAHGVRVAADAELKDIAAAGFKSLKAGWDEARKTFGEERSDKEK